MLSASQCFKDGEAGLRICLIHIRGPQTLMTDAAQDGTSSSEGGKGGYVSPATAGKPGS